ncbi:lysozyme family protein [Peribacillus loiseleuriae]|uniref:Membrane protein n=1 Tax=Peribacillus loiseleuriae TaxID=1679170 RepID=A0A0K9GYN6_9BACI|nr:lysozyme family protein [Peribacillus loiseleuriae]KMY51367.1 membrane protein [Peribacillus loiseleuriae]
MKRKRKISKALFVMFALLFAIVFLKQVIQIPYTEKVATSMIQPDPFASVKKYSTVLHDELTQYNLQEYTVVLIAVMQQESRGKGGDPMQASESAGLAPNTITDPMESIKYGVKHFQRVVAYGKEKNVDFPTIIQSYNMGIGYINYIAEYGGKHSEDLAKKFSMIQVEKNPELYNCGGNTDNFRYPYCYGDFSYSAKVTKNIEALADSLPELVSEKQPDIF